MLWGNNQPAPPPQGRANSTNHQQGMRVGGWSMWERDKQAFVCSSYSLLIKKRGEIQYGAQSLSFIFFSLSRHTGFWKMKKNISLDNENMQKTLSEFEISCFDCGAAVLILKWAVSNTWQVFWTQNNSVSSGECSYLSSKHLPNIQNSSFCIWNREFYISNGSIQNMLHIPFMRDVAKVDVSLLNSCMHIFKYAQLKFAQVRHYSQNA